MIYSTLVTKPNLIKDMISEVQKSGALALGCVVENVWVMFQPVSVDFYIQEGDSSNNTTIVIIKAQAGRTIEVRQNFMQAVAETIGQFLTISPNKVWIHYQEMNHDDIWYAGRLGQ